MCLGVTASFRICHFSGYGSPNHPESILWSSRPQSSHSHSIRNVDVFSRFEIILLSLTLLGSFMMCKDELLVVYVRRPLVFLRRTRSHISEWSAWHLNRWSEVLVFCPDLYWWAPGISPRGVPGILVFLSRTRSHISEWVSWHLGWWSEVLVFYLDLYWWARPYLHVQVFHHRIRLEQTDFYKLKFNPNRITHLLADVWYPPPFVELMD